MTKPNITVALAQNGEAEDVKRLVLAAGFAVPEVGWENIYPHWLVAKRGDEIVGCMEVLLGRPIGRLENLVVDKSLDNYARARVVRSLWFQGIAVLKQYGADLASYMIRFEDKSWKKILKKRGAVVMARGNIMVQRVV